MSCSTTIGAGELFRSDVLWGGGKFSQEKLPEEELREAARVGEDSKISQTSDSFSFEHGG